MLDRGENIWYSYIKIRRGVDNLNWEMCKRCGQKIPKEELYCKACKKRLSHRNRVLKNREEKKNG